MGAKAARVEVAGPGFLNLFLSRSLVPGGRELAVLERGDAFGTLRAAHPERVLVEFVSANPTGPLTVAGARGAAYGDSLARLLDAAGHEVGREYLLNDVGGQVDRFAASIAARMRGSEPPEDGYSGRLRDRAGLRPRSRGCPRPTTATRLRAPEPRRMRERIAATLERFGVRFDTWFASGRCTRRGRSRPWSSSCGREATPTRARERSGCGRTEFGDDKDRVLVREGGEPTYFAADIAYHRDKLERGWERLIDPLGSDHHGYVPRMRASMEALCGADPDVYEAPIMQMVHIVEGGERARMAKRNRASS